MNEICLKDFVRWSMMGQAMFTLDVPVIKGSSALLAFKNDQVAHAKTTKLS